MLLFVLRSLLETVLSSSSLAEIDALRIHYRRGYLIERYRGNVGIDSCTLPFPILIFGSSLSENTFRTSGKSLFLGLHFSTRHNCSVCVCIVALGISNDTRLTSWHAACHEMLVLSPDTASSHRARPVSTALPCPGQLPV